MHNTAAVVGEAPPVLGAAEDEDAVVVGASSGAGRVSPGTVSRDKESNAQRCGSSRRGAPRARRGGGRGSCGSRCELWNGPGTPLPRPTTVSRDEESQAQQCSGGQQGAPRAGRGGDEGAVVGTARSGTGRVPRPRPTSVSQDEESNARRCGGSRRGAPVPGEAEDEGAVVVTASLGTSRVPPGPGRPLCRETRSPRRNNAKVVGEAPPVLGAAGDEGAVAVTASSGVGRATTVSRD
jgi:hypothetical protein